MQLTMGYLDQLWLGGGIKNKKDKNVPQGPLWTSWNLDKVWCEKLSYFLNGKSKCEHLLQLCLIKVQSKNVAGSVCENHNWELITRQSNKWKSWLKCQYWVSKLRNRLDDWGKGKLGDRETGWPACWETMVLVDGETGWLNSLETGRLVSWFTARPADWETGRTTLRELLLDGKITEKPVWNGESPFCMIDAIENGISKVPENQPSFD